MLFAVEIKVRLAYVASWTSIVPGTGSIQRLVWRRPAHTYSTAAHESGSTQDEAKVVPATRVWKGVDSIVREYAPDKGKRHREAMQ